MNSPDNRPPAPSPLSNERGVRSDSGPPLPPHPLDKQWYLNIDGANSGPYSGHDVRKMIASGEIEDHDFVCPEGGTSWVQAKNDPLLGGLFRRKASAQAPQAVTANGGTVVQVTNNIPHPAAALLVASEGAGPKSPGVALLLSLIICGAGQMYNGQVGKGILMLIGCILAWIVFLGWIIWIWSMVDAYSTAKDLNLRYQQRVLAGMT